MIIGQLAQVILAQAARLLNILQIGVPAIGLLLQGKDLILPGVELLLERIQLKLRSDVLRTNLLLPQVVLKLPGIVLLLLHGEQELKLPGCISRALREGRRRLNAEEAQGQENGKNALGN